MGEKIVPRLYLLTPKETTKVLIESRFQIPTECVYSDKDKSGNGNNVYFDFTQYDDSVDSYFLYVVNKLGITLEEKSS